MSIKHLGCMKKDLACKLVQVKMLF